MTWFHWFLFFRCPFVFVVGVGSLVIFAIPFLSLVQFFLLSECVPLCMVRCGCLVLVSLDVAVFMRLHARCTPSLPLPLACYPSCITHSSIFFYSQRLFIRLLNNLKRDLPLSVSGSKDWGVQAFVKIQRSAGIISQTKSARAVLRDVRFRRYFFGSQRSGELSPPVTTISLDTITIFRLADELAAGDVSLRPVGSDEVIDPVMLQEVEPSIQLKHTILGVSFAEREENILTSNIAGFVHVRDVDMTAKTITLLTPCSGPLPGRYLLLGSLKLVDVQ